jgi:ethanolamine ammonia-lyase small subunit
MTHQNLVTIDPWHHLRAYTRARIALGRTGTSLPTEEVLKFGYAHAMARDAVHVPLDVEHFSAGLQASGLDVLQVQSAAPDRATYLLRPDLGRRLDAASIEKLQREERKGCDVLLVVGDGLSSLAVSNHAQPVIEALHAVFPKHWNIGPVVVARQARVALCDHVGELLQARLVLMLVGERPGLTSPDSLGIYITYKPVVGRNDAERNCISNVRPGGLDYLAAARKAGWLVNEAMRLKLSGVALKDESDMAQIANEPLLQLADRA